MDSQTNPRRKVLSVCVARLAQEAGYHQIEKAALETLVEAMQGCKHKTIRHVIIRFYSCCNAL